jgi:hypothetical protein
MLAALALLATSLTYAPDTEFVLAPPAVADSDRARLVVDGWKRSSCDEVAPPHVAVKLGERAVAIDLKVQPGDGACVPVMTRFTRVVDLGPLPAGRWRVTVNGAPMDAGLEVLEGGHDEDLATVDTVDVESVASGGFNAVVSGELQSSCERLDEAKVVAGLRSYDVAAAVIRREGDDCATGSFPFTVRVALPDPAAAGRYLVHVRSSGEPADAVFSVGDLDVIGKDGH